METFLTKTMTIVALICFLVVGAAAPPFSAATACPRRRPSWLPLLPLPSRRRYRTRKTRRTGWPS
jgi:hypothetical protein